MPFWNSIRAAPYAAIIALALVLRVGWALLVPMEPVSDQVAYVTFATNLVKHGTYGWTPEVPTAFWAVGTSAIYAALFTIFGVAYWPIVAFNILIGTLSVVAVMALARQLLGTTSALLAGIILAVWPGQIMYVTVAASELPFTLLVLAAMLSWIRDGWPIWARGVACGLALGMATLIRPVAVLLPGVIFAALLLGPVARLAWQRNAAIMLVSWVVLALCVLPWSARNYKVFGSFVLVSTNGATNFWMGNNPNSTGGYMDPPQRFASLSEVERERMLGKEAIDYVKEKPLQFVLRTVTKLFKQHSKESIPSAWTAKGVEQSIISWARSPLWIVANAYWFAVLLLAVGGIVLRLRSVGAGALFFLPIVTWAYFSATHAVIVADDRYHLPSNPFIAILAASTLLTLLQWSSPAQSQSKDECVT